MKLVVQKYGGSSVATPKQIKAIAQRISKSHAAGVNSIIVVSAMGDSTDDLVKLAHQITLTPHRREMDMLLTTGERVSMALMSMALNDLKTRAVSFTGSQAGIITDDAHNGAHIIDLRPTRLHEALDNGTVVVLAGYQGVSHLKKDVTTLGRGGTDLTAVAIAAHFGAQTCQIMKDVDGVYSADPRVVKTARHIPKLTYQELLEMTFWGAQVLHYRAVELAEKLRVQLSVELAHGSGKTTQVSDSAAEKSLLKKKVANMEFEKKKILSVNSHCDVKKMTLAAKSTTEAMNHFTETLEKNDLSWPQVLDLNVCNPEQVEILITAPSEILLSIENYFRSEKIETFSTVSATAEGSVSSDFTNQMLSHLKKAGITPIRVLFSAMTVTLLIHPNERQLTIQKIHEMFV